MGSSHFKVLTCFLFFITNVRDLSGSLIFQIPVTDYIVSGIYFPPEL